MRKAHSRVDPVGRGDLGRDLVGQARLAPVVHEQIGATQGKLGPPARHRPEIAAQHLHEQLGAPALQDGEVGLHNIVHLARFGEGHEHVVGDSDPVGRLDLGQDSFHDGSHVAAKEVRLLGVIDRGYRDAPIGDEFDHSLTDTKRHEVLVQPDGQHLRGPHGLSFPLDVFRRRRPNFRPLLPSRLFPCAETEDDVGVVPMAIQGSERRDVSVSALETLHLDASVPATRAAM